MSTRTAPETDQQGHRLESSSNRLFGPMRRSSKRLGATFQASKELLESSGKRLQVPVHDIRLRILSLVVFAALAPALVVGMASYSTAKKILTEKLSDQLSTHASTIEERVDQFLRDRDSDTKVFASANVVSQNLSSWIAADAAQDDRAKATSRERLQQYLAQVQQRYPLYRELHIIDRNDRLVSTTTIPSLSALPKIDSRFLASTQKEPLVRSGGRVLAYIHHPIIDPSYKPLGTLVTASSLDDLSATLVAESQNQSGNWIVLGRDRRPLFQSSGRTSDRDDTLRSDAVDLAFEGISDVSEYTNHNGIPVLGAYRFEPANQIAYLVELPREQAFAASSWLRNFAILVSFVAVGLVTGIAFLVILSLTRPIDALIAGAKAAAGGDLSQQIPVSSRDQIGYLTQVFNTMTTSLLDSRQKLEKMTRTDELTGLPNRRELDRMFTTELGRAERSDRPLSVLMLDLDNFKQFNDKYGHQKGDSLLCEASHFLNLNLRPTDIATRYGGEEFVVLLPDATKRQAAALAERLREQFSEACREADESNPWVTISIGVATWPEDGKTREALIRGADTALYSAKRAGRNRVRTAVFPAPLLEQSSVDPHEVA